MLENPSDSEQLNDKPVNITSCKRYSNVLNQQEECNDLVKTSVNNVSCGGHSSANHVNNDGYTDINIRSETCGGHPSAIHMQEERYKGVNMVNSVSYGGHPSAIHMQDEEINVNKVNTGVGNESGVEHSSAPHRQNDDYTEENNEVNIENINILGEMACGGPRQVMTEQTISDPIVSVLKDTRAKYGKNLIFAHVNINGLGNKREYLKELLIKKYLDVLCITESKLGSCYVDNDFHVEGFKMYRKDRKSNSGGLFTWIRSDIPHCRLNEKEYDSDRHHIESMIFDMTIRSQKWFLLLTYKHPKVSNTIFLPKVTEFYDSISGVAKETILLGDINTDMQAMDDVFSKDLCQPYGLSNLITEPTCFKSEKGTLLDPILVTNKYKFQSPFNLHCGSSDWHNMVGCVTRLKVPPQRPTKIQYRSYKNFDELKFTQDVSCIPFHVCEIFDDVHDQYWFASELYSDVINEHAPIKKRVIRTEQIPYMHSELRKEMYKRNMYKNLSFKFRTQHLRDRYTRQRNKVTQMRRDAIKSYFISKCSHEVSPKEFWNFIKPFLSSKSKSRENIILNEGGTIVTDNTEICNIFNEFFSTVASSIGSPDEIDVNEENFIQNVLGRHQSHESVIAIKDMVKEAPVIDKFDFKHVTEDTVSKALSKLKANKATGCDNIPPRLVKVSHEDISSMLTGIINRGFDTNSFPDDMKRAEISPIHKKKDDMIKENYRPVSILVVLAKVYESIIAEQLISHFNPLFNKLLCAYRKKYSCDHILIRLVESWKEALENDRFVGTILMDLSKAFDCIPHGLLICKLHAYGLSEDACLFLSSYLCGRFQRVKVADGRGNWEPLKKGIPQGSCLGPLIFNIFINDLFLFIKKCELYNYADDNTLSVSGSTMDFVIEALKTDTENAVNWFTINFMQANPEKFQVMYMKPFISKDQLPQTLELHGASIERERHVKLLGITIDDRLKFDIQITNMCCRASKQLNVLYRFKNIFNVEEKKIIYNSFILANFNYCPIVWHFCGVMMTRKMEKIQERALRFLLNDFKSSYVDMLECLDIDLLHFKRIKVIACEVYKTLNDLNPSFMKELFDVKEAGHNFRDNNILIQPKFKKITYGRCSFQYYGAHIWNLLPPHIKNCTSLCMFKRMLATWDGPNCSCTLCTFIP